MRITNVAIAVPEAGSPEAGKVLCYAIIEIDGVLRLRGFRLVRLGSRIVLDPPDRVPKADCGCCGRRIGIDAAYCKHCGQSQPPRSFGARKPEIDVLDVRLGLELTRHVMDAYEQAINEE